MDPWMALLAAAPGTKISVPTHIFFRHVGLISDRRDWDGLPFIISNSPRAGGLVEEPFASFVGDQSWRLGGYPGNLLPAAVLYRARSCNRRTYDALLWNCENFVNYCHGLPETSSQVVATVMIAVLGALAFGAAARA
jgi:hypothetical protein